MSHKVSVLFICMGNICRSPTAHAVFRKLVRDKGLEQDILIDSAGTHAYHIGNPPDTRSMETASRRGIEMANLRARQVDLSDFYEFDYLIVMDEANYSNLQKIAPRDLMEKVKFFLEYAPSWGKEVPDPYYGGAQGFEDVFDMVEEASEALLNEILAKLATDAHG